MKATPPVRATRLLVRALRGDPAGPAILGDLHEDFVMLAQSRGPAAARRWYWREALLLCAGFLVRSLPGSDSGDPKMRSSGGFRGLLQDAGSALRYLRSNRGFTIFTAGVIALGIGATTAVFGVLKPLLLAPLPFDEPERLVWIAHESGPGDNSLSAVTSRSGNLRDFRERTQTFAGLTGYNAFSQQRSYTLTGYGEPERLAAIAVAHDFLQVLGVEPHLGRSFTEEEGRWGAAPAIVLSHGFWQRRFAGDPGLVGQAVILNGAPHAVIGVLPATFDFGSVFAPGARVDFLLPFPVSEETDRQGNTMAIIGRMRPGVDPGAAQADLDRVLVALQAEQPNRWGLSARLTPLHRHIAGPLRPALMLLAASAGTVLLIVCVNVSNLLLARVPGRMREVAIRKALGASRGRLIRQLLLETTTVALAGAALGGIMAWVATRLVAGTTGIRVPLLDQVGVDGSALLFGTGVAVLTGLAVGMVPALQVSEGSEAAVLREGGRGGSASRGARRLRESLVIAEVALACLLLVAGGLFLRSFRTVLEIDLGFDAADVVAWQINPGVAFENALEKSGYYGALASRVADARGVEAAGLIDAMPLGRSRSWGFRVAGATSDTSHSVYPHMIDPGYLPALRIPLVAGRNFNAFDNADAPLVAMLNETSARDAFGDADPLGRRIRLWDTREWEVVGIVRDVRHLSPEMVAGNQIYLPLTQMGDFRTMDLVVRSSLPVDQVTANVATVLREVDPALPTGEFWTLQSRVHGAVSVRRFTLGMLTTYGAIALFLAGLGIYGVLAHSVAERRPEIGIRMALGASSSEVLWSVIGRTLLLACVGIAAGALLSLWSARLLQSLLFGVSATDPFTFAGMAVALLAVAAIAGAIPAVRAARTKAIGALRADVI